MVGDLDRALEALGQVRALLAEPLSEAERVAAAVTGAGGQDWHASPPTGWEEDLQARAAAAGRYADALAGHLREHGRTAAEHAQAAPLAGIRRAPAPLQQLDETAPGFVASTAVATAATKPRAVELGTVAEVDRDELFEAVEDLVVAVDVTTAAGNALPDPIAEAIDEPAGRLFEAWAGQSGDGPLEELVGAARAVVAAARPHAALWPPTLTAAATAVETALT